VGGSAGESLVLIGERQKEGFLEKRVGAEFGGKPQMEGVGEQDGLIGVEGGVMSRTIEALPPETGFRRNRCLFFRGPRILVGWCCYTIEHLIEEGSTSSVSATLWRFDSPWMYAHARLNIVH
jgi:hypothetical protein